MGKKNKHSQDKLYQTVQELSSHHQAGGTKRDLDLSILHRRLKFDSCCLTLSTITGKPMGLCDDDGYCYVFECDMIIKFLEKYKMHPITGKKVSSKDIIELKFHKNNEDLYHCPVLYKLFNTFSKIVANKKNGHVYSYEAYQQLNLKPKNLKDLLTDEPFEKSDIVTIQDPDIADTKWNVNEFYYIKNKLSIEDKLAVSNVRDIDKSSIFKSSIEEYKKNESAFMDKFNKAMGQPSGSSNDRVNLDKTNSASYSDGVLAKSVTSTVMPVTSQQRPAMLNQEQIIYPKVKKKGYVQVVTNFGPINLELYCNRAPKTCHNFLLLASRGYYDNTCFHRLIKNFIIQGGDPTGTGSGGQSAWGEPFKDECHNDLKHVGRGVLAMANSGPGTNKSQFYITLKGVWDHLDGKHTVFGRMVGGDETLAKIEDLEVDKDERPKKEVKILNIIKYVDPFEEVEAELEAERKNLSNKSSNSSDSPHRQPLKKFRSGVGAYIDLDVLRVSSKTSEISTKNGGSQGDSLASKLASLDNKRKSTTRSYGDFSNW